ncbi:MAG: metal-sulfur cluster assembly factor [Longimicrobiales bacterium]
MDEVARATSRTHHELHTNEPSTDPRYRSDDPALDAIWVALRDVADPELPVSLVDLGLICDVRRHDSTVEVDITFTATACPCMGFIRQDLEERLKKDATIETVVINERWDPPWTTERMTKEGKAQLRSCGVAA